MDKLITTTVPLASSSGVTNRKEILELKAEEKNKVKVNDVSNDRISGIKVVFENKKGELMALRISDENYKNLQEHFGSYTNYIARNDKSIRLNGEANEFIANWFEKASNGFLNFNTLSDNEESKTISVKFGNTKGLENLKLMQGVKSEKSGLEENANLQEKLNFALDKDINQDGDVDKKDVKEPTMEELLRSLSEDDTDENETDVSVGNVYEELMKTEEDEDLLKKAKEKGLSALSADERARLEASNPQEFEKLQDKSLEDLSQNLSKDLQTQLEAGEALFVDKRV
ncbi:hypothetical protein [Campylobacter sp. VTCC 70190]|uniref:hypothetical protein n=1 Tax=Campylobacter sp. VTCC 70190 TaxID=3392118 RepID=UPI00398E7DFC